MTAILRIIKDDGTVAEAVIDASVEIGRQASKADLPFVRLPATGKTAAKWRINIAAIEEVSISRDALRLEPLGSDKVRITNLSSRCPVNVEPGGPVPFSASHECRLPCTVIVANKSLRLEAEPDDANDLQSLAQPTIAPGLALLGGARQPPIGKLKLADGEQLLQWFGAVTAVLQSATNSEEFFQRAADAMVDLVNLNSGRVLLTDGSQWRISAASYQDKTGDQISSVRPSDRILRRMLEERRTFWSAIGQASADASLVDVQAVVAAPILDAQGCVIGALYGDRLSRDTTMGPPITQLEAMLVETLACSVAAGLARLEQQRAAVAAQVRFEQFFTPELARHLAAQPDLLKGREAEVTLLFCDVRGFSRISERLSPAATVEWIGSVMSVLSDCVMAHQGVLVDYIGDELIAMWGAPSPSSNHARQACAAAADMVQALQSLNQHWESRLHEPTRVGIGINTGPAYVGNTGSTHKFKYGPLGNTVNMASRVQGATKYLRVDALMTGATRSHLDAHLPARRLCTVRVLNIAEPVDLFQLPVAGAANWQRLCDAYQAALLEFEAKNFRKALLLLSQLTLEFPDDSPSLALLSRTVSLLINEPANFTPVWDLPGK